VEQVHGTTHHDTHLVARQVQAAGREARAHWFGDFRGELWHRRALRVRVIYGGRVCLIGGRVCLTGYLFSLRSTRRATRIHAPGRTERT
jgi:hypothetical protein